MDKNSSRPAGQPDGTHTGMGGPGAAKPVPVSPVPPIAAAPTATGA